MSSTIRTTIESAVGTIPAGYQSVLDNVVEAVEGLAAQAADSLRESGRALGANTEQIESALVSAGLVEPEPTPEATDSDLGARVGRIEEAVSRLTALAERHLGRL